MQTKPLTMLNSLRTLLCGGLLLTVCTLSVQTVSAQPPAAWVDYLAYALDDTIKLATVDSNGQVSWEALGKEWEDYDGDGLLNGAEFEGWSVTVNGVLEYYTSNWNTWNTMPPGAIWVNQGPAVYSVDTECDGISDLLESLAGINPLSGDTDRDGLQDAVEAYSGMDPRDDGMHMSDGTPLGVGEYTLQYPGLDPDGDGLTTETELRSANVLIFACASNAASRFPYEQLDATSWTSPLNCDSDNDWLLDSYERAFSIFDPVVTDDRTADPDVDGLSNFREQCLHPLISKYVVGGTPTPWDLSLVSAFNVPAIGNRFGTAMIMTPGYLATAMFNKAGDAEAYFDPLTGLQVGTPGEVTWLGYAFYWTDPGVASSAWDSDADMLPDGWEVEHGLNPLNSLLSHGTLGNPDDDQIVNVMEYYGADGYRIDYVSGTGDETSPWITRARNTGSSGEAPYGFEPGIWMPALPPELQPSFAPGDPLLTESVYPPELYPGFFDPLTIDVLIPANTIWTPVPGVPSFVFENDMETLTAQYGADFTAGAGAFQPFLLDGLFYDDINADGRYTPGTDSLWFGTETYAVPPACIPLTTAPAPVVGDIGRALTDNWPLMTPIYGMDTDQDGLPDNLELRMDVARGMEPSSGVQSHNPLIARSAMIKVGTGLEMFSAQAEKDDYFGRDFTVEMWVYLASGSPTGVLARGETPSGAAAFELGLTGGIPYIAFDTVGGTYRYETSSTRPIPTQQWVHLAGAFDHADNALSLYLNGALEQSRQVLEETAGFMESSGKFIFGRSLDPLAVPPDVFDDFADTLWIDEIRVWSVARTAMEVVENFNHLILSVQPGPKDFYGTQNANGLVAYYTFDDSGRSAESLVKSTWCSLTGYTFPHETNVLNYPNGKYLYPDSAYSLPTTNFGGGFIFDAGLPAPIDGGLDNQRGEWDSDGDLLPDSWEIIHELNPFAQITPPRQQVPPYDGTYAFLATPEVLIKLDNRTWQASLDFGNTWVSTVNPIEVSMINGVIVTSMVPSHVIIGESTTTVTTNTSGTNTTVTTNTVVLWNITSGWATEFMEDGESWWFAKSGMPVSEVGVTGAMVTDADGDLDNDGLTNLEEYWARTNPRKVDTDENSIPDGDEDFDSDGLSNGQEARNTGRPDLVDTDDDGMTDGAEVAAGSIVSDSTSPKQHLAAYFNSMPGTWLEVADRSALVQSSWTIEAKVLPSTTNFLAEGQGCPIFRRAVEEATNGTFVANYELRIVRTNGNLYPEARFVYKTADGNGIPVSVRGTNALAISATYNATSMTHLAATYDGLGKRLTLYVNGLEEGTTQDLNHSAPVNGEGPVSVIRIGERFQGFVDELRLWKSARDAASIASTLSETLEGQEADLVAYFNFDDGGWPTLDSNTWSTGMAPMLYSVMAEPTPEEMRDGDTWLSGGQIYVNDSGNIQILTVSGPIFSGTDTIPAGGGTEGDFGWNSEEGVLYRCNADGAVFQRWGQGRYWLAPARTIIKREIATFSEMVNWDPTPGDKFLCSGAGEQVIYIYNGSETNTADPLLDGQQFYLLTPDSIVQWDEAGSALVPVAIPAAASNLYIQIESEGTAYKYEDSVWRWWGFIPSTEDYTVLRDWEQQWRSAAKMSGLVEFFESAAAQNGYVPSGGTDTDGDGLPDSWEIRYGLNPNDGGFGGATASSIDVDGDGQVDYIYNTADFVNGAWGDPDEDGLNNRAEYLTQRTNPMEFDTDGDGTSDYEAHSPTNIATYGSLYMDGDNIPDGWESLYPTACSPLVYDANQDPDGDGWDNYSEYMAYYLTLNATVYTVTTNTDGTVSSNFSSATGYSIPYCNPTDPVVYPKPRITFTFKTDCPEAAGDLYIWAYNSPEMNCPDAMTSMTLPAPIRDGNSLSITDWTEGGHLRQGDTYFMAFVDENSDGQWTEGELLGFSEYMPEDISWGDPTVEIALREQANGFARISWGGSESTDTNAGSTVDYVIRILRNGSVVYENTRGGCSANRTYLHEFDFRNTVGTFANISTGAMYGVYTWQVRNSENVLLYTGTNTVDYPATLATPLIHNPIGNILYAKDKLQMTLDPNTTQIQITIQNTASGATVLNSVMFAPYINRLGMAEMDLPALAGFGSLTNGAYRIQVRAFNPRATKTSSWMSFAVNLQTPNAGGPGMISGRANYFGWSTNADIVVEAFLSSGFGQRPVAKVTADSNNNFELMGLAIGDYYVRAFHDMDGDGELDAGEAWGLVKGAPAAVNSINWVIATIRRASARGGVSIAPVTSIYASDYSARVIELKSTVELSDYDLVIHDADADNDGLPDIWEKTYARNYNSMNQFTDLDADGLLDAAEFENNTDPGNPDTDGDGLLDGAEITTYGTDPLVADSDGDGFNDEEEVTLGLDGYLTDPLDPDSDADSLSDSQEMVNGTDPGDSDSDNDGLLDGWEVEYALLPIVSSGDNGAAGDPDGDGLLNLEEQTRGTNPQSSDSDGDGLPDGWEVANALDPLSATGDDGADGDADGDGLTNGEELVAGTSPSVADQDLDGVSDADELLNGTNPNNPDSDGDGFNDGVEAILGDNPVAGGTAPTEVLSAAAGTEHMAVIYSVGIVSNAPVIVEFMENDNLLNDANANWIPSGVQRVVTVSGTYTNAVPDLTPGDGILNVRIDYK